MTFTIERCRGMWRAQIDHRTEFGYSLEDLLSKLDPNAPLEHVAHATEILSGILGVEYLPVYEWLAAMNDTSFLTDDDTDEFPRGV